MSDLPIFYAPDVAVDGLLPEGEAGHCLRVLRGQCGDRVVVCDGRGTFYLSEIAEISKRLCRVQILERHTWQKTWQGEITLALAPTKAIERMEWLLEKAVEVGVDRVLLLRVKHSERKHINTERLERIMLSAMKQSQKAVLPTLSSEVSLSDAIAQTSGATQLLLHCREADGIIAPRALPHLHYQGAGDVCLFIGPEGDFSREEVEQAQAQGLHPTTLGDTRLRTETAALSALQWVHTLQLIQR